jgi:all-trans-retinol 13,14-reductase
MKNLYHSSLQNEKFDAIIIGSGLGGLTTASLLAKSNKKVLILEKHYVAGGFTHTFKRGKFVWDVGVHYVGQMHNEDALMRKIFDYATDHGVEWSFMDEVYDKAIIQGDEYSFLCGTENQIRNLLMHFPGEEKAIRKYYDLVRNMGTSTSMFFGERSMPRWLSGLIGRFLRKKFYTYSDKTTYQVLSSLTCNEKLISVLCAQCGNYGLTPQKSSFAIQAIIAEHYAGGGNYPVGGASAIFKSLLDVIEKHKGVLALKAEVDHIVLRENRAIGVKLKNGDTLFAPIIISNAGVRNTFKKFLPSNLKSCETIRLDLEKIKPSTAHICLYLGLNASDKDLNLPKYNYWLYNTYDFDLAFTQHLLHPESDPPLAYISFPSAKDPGWAAGHPGMATVQVIAAASYQWVEKWENFRWAKRGDEYEAFKESFKNKMLDKLYRIFPQIRDHLEICEISSPLSTKHFSNHPSGEIYGLEHTPERFRLNWLRVHTPVKNLFLTGQDIITVGIGGALFSGVLTASSILKKNFLWHALRHKAEIKNK